MSIEDGAKIKGDLTLDTDVVIIGSGASGAVVAAELADAGQSVLVLEEGSHIPQDVYGKMRISQQMRTMWRDAGLTFALGVNDSPMINVMMGKCVGGSSLLTGGVCFRIPDAVLREWHDEMGLKEMTPRLMEPAFEAVEKAIHVQEVPAWMRSRSTLLFGDGLQKAHGAELKPLKRNVEGCKGYSRCNFGCPVGAKLSVDHNYLPRATAKGVRILSHALVEKIVTKGDRAVGIRGRLLTGPEGYKAGKLTVHARRVVLAAGAYHSPQILLRSGLANSSDQVGRNLTLHPSFRVMGLFDHKVEGWRGALQTAYSDAFERERITLMSMFTPPGVLAATMPGIGPEHHHHAMEIPNLAVFGGLIHDDGGGRIQRGIGREPMVTYNMSERDKVAVGRALKIMGEAYFAAGAKQVFLPILGLGGVDADKFRSVDFDHFPRKRLECASQHPLGTCRMGTSPGRSVVNPDGESWDVKDLFIVDGSILPTSLGVNPQVSVMSMATRIAWKMRELPLRQLVAA